MAAEKLRRMHYLLISDIYWFLWFLLGSSLEGFQNKGEIASIVVNYISDIYLFLQFLLGTSFERF